MKPLQRADYPDAACDCEKCAGYCQRFPCRPLPDEVTLGMPAKVQARLMLNYLNGADGDVEHLQAGAVDYEGEHFPESAYGLFGIGRTPMRCTFLTDDGKCELHGKCKPFEGRKATCSPENYPKGHHDTALGLGFRDRLSELIIEAWDTDTGRAVVAKWKEEHQR